MPIKPVIVKIINLNMEVNQSQCTTCTSTIPSCESPRTYFKNLRFKLNQKKEESGAGQYFQDIIDNGIFGLCTKILGSTTIRQVFSNYLTP